MSGRSARKYALVIGNSSYDDPALARLKTPEADVQSLADALRDPAIGGFDEVKVLLNEQEAAIRRAISTFYSKKKTDDLLMLYFSGHGVLDAQGRLFLAVRDTQHELLNATAIAAAFITDDMDSCRSKRQVLVLDCCHSGAFARGAKGELNAVTRATFEGNGYGRVVLTASDSTQFALEGDQVDQEIALSLFTNYLLQGLTSGEADRNDDGWVSVDEWYDYAYEQVLVQTPNQTPKKWAYNTQGELVIARSPRPRTTEPEDLPRYLRTAVESEMPRIRLEVLDELERLLEASNPGLALAATETLQRMAEKDDSYTVRKRAARVLAEHAPAQPALEKPDPFLEETYHQALAAAQAGAWRRAEDLLEQIQERQADYHDVAQLRERVAAEIAREQAEAGRQAGGLAASEELGEGTRSAPEETAQAAGSGAEREALAGEKPPDVQRAAKARGAKKHRRPLQIGLVVLGLVGLVFAILLFSQLTSGVQEPFATIVEQSQVVPRGEQGQVAQEVEQSQAAPGGEQGQVPPIEELGRIAFLSNQEGALQINTMNPDGSQLEPLIGEPLAKDPLREARPDWSPVRQKFVFASSRVGNFDIYTMNPDGSELTPLTDNPEDDVMPAWSPDGEYLAYVSTRDGNPEIYLMRADGSEQTRLTNDPGLDLDPAWSPDGEWLAFASARQGNLDIYLTSVDGKQFGRLTDDPADDGRPAWSPNGELILFNSTRDGNVEIYVTNADGSGQAQNLTNKQAADESPAWSPSGEQIVFASDRDGNFEIYIMNADGSNLRRLTDSPGEDFSPIWME